MPSAPAGRYAAVARGGIPAWVVVVPALLLVLAWPEVWKDETALAPHLIRARSGNYGLIVVGSDEQLEEARLEASPSDSDLTALVDWIGDLPVHINLIPYNPIPDAAALRPTPKPRREAFANALKARGFKVTLRYSLGADVTAACGQLVRDENRRERT